jgi:hypothetical protein
MFLIRKIFLRIVSSESRANANEVPHQQPRGDDLPHFAAKICQQISSIGAR